MKFLLHHNYTDGFFFILITNVLKWTIFHFVCKQMQNPIIHQDTISIWNVNFSTRNIVEETMYRIFYEWMKTTDWYNIHLYWNHYRKLHNLDLSVCVCVWHVMFGSIFSIVLKWFKTSLRWFKSLASNHFNRVILTDCCASYARHLNLVKNVSFRRPYANVYY